MINDLESQASTGKISDNYGKEIPRSSPKGNTEHLLYLVPLCASQSKRKKVS